MFKDALLSSRVLVGTALVAASLMGNAGAAHAEELTVYDSPALSAQAAKAALDADMKAYRLSLDRAFREALAEELEEAVAPRRILLAANDIPSRG